MTADRAEHPGSGRYLKARSHRRASVFRDATAEQQAAQHSEAMRDCMVFSWTHGFCAFNNSRIYPKNSCLSLIGRASNRSLCRPHPTAVVPGWRAIRPCLATFAPMRCQQARPCYAVASSTSFLYPTAGRDCPPGAAIPGAATVDTGVSITRPEAAIISVH
jgi:hypothetical protein